MREVENEREGCCSAWLAAHFVEQPAGTMKNSEEGFTAVRRGGRRKKMEQGGALFGRSDGGAEGEKVSCCHAGRGRAQGEENRERQLKLLLACRECTAALHPCRASNSRERGRPPRLLADHGDILRPSAMEKSAGPDAME
jgi:hypothetical protein